MKQTLVLKDSQGFMRIWKIFSDIALFKLILENAFLLHYNKSVRGLNTHIRRRIEAVITGRTRNAFGGQLPRGFESLRLRFIVFLVSVC